MTALRILTGVLLLATSARASEVRTLSGKTISGALQSLSEKEIVVKTAAGEVTVPVADVLRIDLQPESGATLDGSGKYTDIELTDGTLLHCAKFEIKGKEVEARLQGTELTLRFPLAAVGYLLNQANDPALRKEWLEKTVPSRGNQDILAVKVEGVINAIEGTFAGAAGAEGKLTFEYGSADERRKKEIDLANPLGVIFQRAVPADAAPQLCKVSDKLQNVFVAARLTLTPKILTVDTLCGAHFDLPLDAIARLDYSNDKIVFLSDLKPAELIQTSRQGRKDALRLDKNLDNGVLQVEGQVYPKGLAMHSYTELVYNLDGKYAKFDAVLGMDDQVRGDGRPVVRIEADGKELFAGTVTRKDHSHALSCNVKGSRQLKIVVSSSGLFDFSDHVDLVNAKLSK
jgi:hypothetical protein